MNITVGLDPTLTLIESIELFLLIFALVLYAFNAPKTVVKATLVIMAALHILYVIRYAKTYELEIHVKPFIDVFYSKSRETVSALIDVSQLVILLLLIDYVITIYNKRKNTMITDITPTSLEE
ncbi:hypothetical protein PYJP_14150 [Pyrofollis japonicus]|uniref:hypothetical protein n=1 Tax=Pyrofollis japonicus TaxID=3060460 RepID=UPI00295BCB8C|nr:hypothetical protein [Pyrofollis japonicus]BEP18063.1 hypothetical protein PYJP_14150 [Pyrofollis japonicus]